MNNKTVSLPFSTGDLPVIAHAFSIARASAMLCGNKVAQKRLDEYTNMVEALIPDEARLFEAEHWCEIIIAIAECREWSISIGWPEWVRNHYSSGGRIRVRVDEKVWLHDWLRSSLRQNGPGEFKATSPEFIAVRELLQEFAGLDSKEVEETQ